MLLFIDYLGENYLSQARRPKSDGPAPPHDLRRRGARRPRPGLAQPVESDWEAFVQLGNVFTQIVSSGTTVATLLDRHRFSIF